jgi:hypothetical protein
MDPREAQRGEVVHIPDGPPGAVGAHGPLARPATSFGRRDERFEERPLGFGQVAGIDERLEQLQQRHPRDGLHETGATEEEAGGEAVEAHDTPGEGDVGDRD